MPNCYDCKFAFISNFNITYLSEISNVRCNSGSLGYGIGVINPVAGCCSWKYGVPYSPPEDTYSKAHNMIVDRLNVLHGGCENDK